MLVVARAKGDRQAELEALFSIGFWRNMRGHYDEATPYLHEALALAHAVGDHTFQEERALYGLGQGAFERGDRDTAENLFRACLAVVATLDVDRRDEIAEKFANIGEFLCEYRSKREEGCQMLAQAQAIYHEIGQSAPRWLDDEQHMRDLRRLYGDESGKARLTRYISSSGALWLMNDEMSYALIISMRADLAYSLRLSATTAGEIIRLCSR